jgi:hypothetical protein
MLPIPIFCQFAAGGDGSEGAMIGRDAGSGQPIRAFDTTAVFMVLRAISSS